MRRIGLLLVGIAVLLGVAGAGWLAAGWYTASSIDKDSRFVVSSGSTLTSVARQLEEGGHIASADAFLLRAKILGGGDPVQAGEFMLPAGISPARILETFQTGDVIRRFVTIPEGMPSIMVHERLMAEPLLTGEIPVPEEGSILPDTYDFERGEDRTKVLARMQVAMRNFLAEAWPKRKSDIAVNSPEDAVILASIVEKETGVSSERQMVAGLYSNRVKQGMLLQADPTIIYPITRGKPLGRRIRQSEIAAINDYNTYTMTGLPKGPITNPGRASIEAVLDPAKTSALFMVADGKGGHVFADTLEEHNANVDRWFALRRERGEM
ncbi:endolytic transglycosylase MltG [Pontixanthobacter aquaemixtae]|uniref:Endolytic murein transglycosylase n=1 Tax=Pontixanthobacter aquaemixtae TaxID=1958940 RepID=A0A844ZST9_9SPHN|nr:endolytic transglycosylase MltG [Pontixanthobacter aquaemixtae]MXO89867.1 endolytic transglycosylase MltG [Pontixanthobacter aquaemixtae]